MSRKKRSITPGTVYHLISRFVDREWFIRDPVEREHYVRLLHRAVVDSDWRLLAYAVMSNHIHLALVAGEQTLASWIRRVHAPFATTMNRSYGRIGPMFARGPKMFAVEPDGVGQLLAYIHNNPVRAGVCARAAESDWTSHRAYVCGGMSAGLHVAEGLARAGFHDAADFDRWVDDPERSTIDELFTEATHELRLTIAHDAAAAARAAWRPSPEAIVLRVADVLGISTAILHSRSRAAATVLGREIAARAASRLDHSGISIARALQISQQRVSAILRATPTKDVLEMCRCVLDPVWDERVRPQVELARLSG